MIDLDAILDLLIKNPEAALVELEKEDYNLKKLKISKEEALSLLTSGEKRIKKWNSIRTKLEMIEGIINNEKSKHGVTFMMHNLKFVNFENISLPKIDLRDIDLDSVNFIGANLRGCEL